MTLPGTGPAEARVSVVITNYNYVQFVVEATASALGQVGGGVEVIVVDDGSSDGSVEALRAFGDDITVIACDNGGQASAFNVGFAATSAPIVVFLDADDRIHQGLAQQLVEAFADPDIGRVQFRMSVIDATGSPTGAQMPPEGKKLSSGDLRRELTSFPDDIIWQPTSGNAFRREVLTAVLPMPVEDYRLCADYYLSNISALYGHVAVLPTIGGDYRIHGNNGHFAHEWTLAQLRSDIIRTSVTHRHLIERSRRMGLDGLPEDPDRVLSVTSTAHRLISVRVDAVGHPIVADRRCGLVAHGVRAAAGRFDVGIGRRLVFAGWFIAMGAAPRGLARRLAAMVLPTATSHGAGT